MSAQFNFVNARNQGKDGAKGTPLNTNKSIVTVTIAANMGTQPKIAELNGQTML
jgi:hypothetical protein